MHNAFSIDTEDWFQVFYGADVIYSNTWSSQESHIQRMLDKTFELLNSKNIKATFFILGWIVEKNPYLARRITENGHEIASHGFWHEKVFELSPEKFKIDIINSKNVIEQATGQSVFGYRAPGYSMSQKDIRYLDLLSEAGYKYDSSLLDFYQPIGKLPQGLIEVRPNSLNIFGNYFPSNGGFFFRAIPYKAFRLYAKYLNSKKIPLVFYSHTWEIYTNYPRINMDQPQKFIQYFNLKSVEKKIKKLLIDFQFDTIQNLVEDFNKHQNLKVQMCLV